ncbi:type II CRISPR-associated endonuclease Cas1 [Solibacillus sp. FSL H8-0538]|uniref:type II CRISPR-associated endonuclease Cas1 n=1 Tax=Solibacillus sp. FSL H8-0538 TaxID=2921400 RepID=UPI0030F5EB3B
MTWRTVILTKESKLSLRMENLVIVNDEVNKIPISEIGILVIENPSIVITGHLLNALSNQKITTILCDQKHIPSSVIQSVYGHHRQSKNIVKQFQWNEEYKGVLWKYIIQQKIYNQGQLLKFLEREGYDDLLSFVEQVEMHDATNREGHAAKVYFNRLFNSEFTRGSDDELNWGIDYGYTILHSLIARQIVSKGYLSEIGIHHINEYNQYNLASDFIEVFRPIVDFIVIKHVVDQFGKEQRRQIIEMLNYKIFIKSGEHYLAQAVQMFIDGCINFLNTGEEDKLNFPIMKFEKYKV